MDHNTIVLFHKYSSHSSEQPEQRTSAHKSEQSTAGCMAIFHKYCRYIKHGGIITNLNLWNPWGYVTGVSKCQGVKHGLEYITFYFQKHIAPLAALFWSPAWSPRAARGPTFVKVAYSQNLSHIHRDTSNHSKIPLFYVRYCSIDRLDTNRKVEYLRPVYSHRSSIFHLSHTIRKPRVYIVCRR